MRLKELLKKTAVTACAAAMTITLVAGSGMVAKAATSAGIIDTNKTGSLTIYKKDYSGTTVTATGTTQSNVPTDAKPLAGVVFSYAKVATIETVSDVVSNKGDVVVKYKATAEGAALLGLTADTLYTQAQIDTALASSNKGTLESTTSNLTAMSATGDSDGKATATGLTLGLYLVVETKTPQSVVSTTDPFLVSIPMTDSATAASGNWNYDVVVYPKNQTGEPTIDKKVRDNQDTAYADYTSVSMGDTVSYQITSKLPKITTPATYLGKYEFVDTLATGLSYKKDTAVAIKVGTNLTLTKDTDFTVTYNDTANTMTIALTTTGLGKINPHTSGTDTVSYSEANMVITYEATVDNTATDAAVMGDSGNANTVVLTYGRTNEDKSASIEDTAKVYTYGIDLTKKFSDASSSADVTTVNFILKRKNANNVEEYITFTGENGVYYANGVNSAEASATKVSPSSSKSLKLYGLEADTYSLTEVQTASGYSLLKQPITIVITPTSETTTVTNGVSSTTVTNATATVDATYNNDGSVKTGSVTMTSSGTSTNALVPLTITNTKSFTLPQTGGLGAIICTMIGAVVFAGAVIFLRKKA